MTEKEKKELRELAHYDVALRLAGYGLHRRGVDEVRRLFKLVEVKGGKVTLEDVTKIQDEIKSDYDTPELKSK